MNVTPLVDVVLVLLIIFMVVAPMLENAAQLELPAIANIDAERKGRADPISLSLDRTGQIYLEEERLSEREVEARLRALHAADARRRIILRGDRGLPFKKARDLFALCQNVGFRGVSLVVAKEGEGRAGPSRGGS